MAVVSRCQLYVKDSSKSLLSNENPTTVPTFGMTAISHIALISAPLHSYVWPHACTHSSSCFPQSRFERCLPSPVAPNHIISAYWSSMPAQLQTKGTRHLQQYQRERGDAFNTAQERSPVITAPCKSIGSAAHGWADCALPSPGHASCMYCSHCLCKGAHSANLWRQQFSCGHRAG